MYTAAKVRFSFFAATLASIFCLAICLRVLRSCAVHNLIVFLRVVFFNLAKIASLSLRRTKVTIGNRKGQLNLGPPSQALCLLNFSGSLQPTGKARSPTPSHCFNPSRSIAAFSAMNVSRAYLAYSSVERYQRS